MNKLTPSLLFIAVSFFARAQSTYTYVPGGVPQSSGNSYMGIGTSAPQARFHLRQAAEGWNDGLRFSSNGQDWNFLSDDTGNRFIIANGQSTANAVLFHSAGHGPTLEVNGVLGVNGSLNPTQLVMASGDGQTQFSIQRPATSSDPFSISLGYQSVAGGIMIGRPDWLSKVLIPWNLALGSAAPTAKLHVQQNAGGWSDGIRLSYQNKDWDIVTDTQGDRLLIAKGQSTANGMVMNNGNVGIGITTTVPTEKLDIGGYDKINIRVGQWATLGIIGSHLATVLGNNVKASSVNNNMEILTNTTSDGAKAIKMQYNEGITFHTLIGQVTAGDAFSSERMRIDNNGNVGIGTTNPGSFRLAVNGKIWTQEVNVQMNNPGPDYVFEKDYNLLPLAEVESYINQNKHLPEVPSAKEMEEEGLNLKEMNLLLLKKVEELTLHLIEQQKHIAEQDKKIDLLMKK